jgi:hypothetical protein
MEKLSDEELLQKYDDHEWNEHKFYTSSAYKKEYNSLRAEILKRMVKVDVAGIAREIAALEFQSWNHVPEGVLQNSADAIEEILRSHLEGKSE